MHSNAAPSLAALERCYTLFFVLANHQQKMSETLPMCSTMTTLTTRRIISIVLVVLVVLAPKELPLLCLPLTVCFPLFTSSTLADNFADQKQARDLVSVLTEAKQQIDPRLAEMTRYGGGGGGGRYGGGFRGGRGGGRGGKLN
jgi:hypothetical protein